MIGKSLLALALLLAGWIIIDLAMPRKTDLRRFDPQEAGKLDAAMWRSYYEGKPVKLFFQLARLMRSQFRAPFWRSFLLAYRAAKAAFVFKNGHNRQEYAKALFPLEQYYAGISRLSSTPFDVRKAAESELEWWIIRREPALYTTADWERLLAETAAIMYHLPTTKFPEYARLRTEAMVLRDGKRDQITEADWAMIDARLKQTWNALYNAVQ